MDWITTSNIETEIWRRLLEFANIEISIEEITARHGVPSKDGKANYQKQARQIRVCLLQAREFFTAARESSLFTSPNHLYYGMMSLASAIMLLRANGTKSLDLLRKDTTNRHHGLIFTSGINAAQAAEGYRILENSKVEILNHGHFRNWYETISPEEYIYARVDRLTGNTKMSVIEQVGSQRLADADGLVGRKVELLNLIQFIPELALDLARFGALRGVWSRTNYSVTIDHNSQTHKFAIHGASGAGGLDALLDKFRVPIENIDRLFISEISENNLSCVVIFSTPLSVLPLQYPCIRRSSDLAELMYDGEFTIAEMAESYLFTYGLSMLSRYYPDHWITCIESHGKAAKLIERAVSVLLEKFPLLALNEMNRKPINISTHRPPWHT